VERGGQQPVIAAVGLGSHRTQRHAACFGDQQALQALLAAVDRAPAGDLAAAGRLGDAAIHRQVLQVQAEHPVIGG
jgi:hypothetical protein